MLNQGRDVAPVPAYVEQQSAQVRRWSQENEQKCIVSEGSDDRVAFLVLEDGGVEWTVHRRSTERLSFVNERRNSRGKVLIVEAWSGESFNQESVFAKHQNGVDSRTLSKRAREISYVRHCWE